MDKLKKKSLVMIKKTPNAKDHPFGWNDEMDAYVGQIDEIRSSGVGPDEIVYELVHNAWSWAREWLVPLDKEQYLNIRRLYCSLCREKTKKIIVKLENLSVTQRYCPKCQK